MSEIALYNALTKLGLEPNEAKEVVTDVASSKEVATKADITELKAATKADITELKTETKADIAELKTETKADIKDMATKTDLANLEAKLVEKMANLETRLTKLIYTVVVINTGVIIAAVGLMIKFLN